MQTYLNVRAMNVGNDASQSARGTDVARALPVGRETSATVLQVSQSTSQPGQFILQLQIGNRTLELATPRPFPQGSQVILNRDAQGNIQLQIPTNPPATAAADASRIQNAPAQARADAESLLMRINAGSTQQASNLPLNQPQRGIILAQPIPVPSQAATQAPVQAPTQASTQAPAQAPTQTPVQAPAQAPTQTPVQAPVQAPAQMPIQAPVQAPTQTPIQAPVQAPTQTPTQTPIQAPVQAPAQAPTQAPVQAPTQAPTQTPIQAPVQAPAQAPTQTPIQAPTQVTAQSPIASLNLTTNAAAVGTTTPSSPSSPLSNLMSQNDVSNRPQGFPVRVLVASQVLDLVSPRPVQSGQQVDVTRNEQGLIRIQFTQPTLPLAQQAAVQAIMQQTLREVLPVQLPLADGLNQLMQISERQGARQNNALNQLIQSMLGLFSVKPGAADADKAIARNLQQGGLLSEAGLSRAGQQMPPADLKQQLGQLLKVADQLPAQAREQLNQLVNALLARSTAQQISSLQRWRDLPDGGQERHYRLDLPIQQQQGFDNAELRITEHRRRNEEGEFVTLWSVRLHFELEDDGAVDAELSLQDRFQLNANFWVEKPETLAKLRERLSSFEQELKMKGFEVAPLNARLGKLANPEVTPLSKRLVDIHT